MFTCPLLCYLVLRVDVTKEEENMLFSIKYLHEFRQDYMLTSQAKLYR